MAFSPDGKRLASGSADGTVKVWDALTGQETLTLKGHNGRVASVAFSPDGQRIASGSRDGTVKVWDALTGQETLTLKGHTKGISSVVFSPDGQRARLQQSRLDVEGVGRPAAGRRTCETRPNASLREPRSRLFGGGRLATAQNS